MNRPGTPSFKMTRGQLAVLVCFMVTAVVLAFFGGRYAERGTFGAQDPGDLAFAVQALQSGHDQTALSALKPLADSGDPKAQYWLADMYENGLGVKTNMPATIALLGESAAHGFVPAERRLGELYLYGDETLQEFGLARTWLHQAAVAGDGAAERDMGQIYALGLGVAVDLPRAYAWYENAVLHGDGMAAHLRDDLVARLTPDGLAKGEQTAKALAAEIRPAKPA